MIDYFTPNNILLLTLATAGLNLLTPFVSKRDTNARSSLMLLVSFAFLLNVLLIDWLYLEKVETYLLLFAVDEFKIAINFEPLGLIFLSLLAVMWNFALMYTIKFLTVNEMEHTTRFLFFVNACILCGIFIALSANLFTMFIFYELLTICTIPLIVHSGRDKAREGLLKYLKILMISSLIFFLPAIIFLYAFVGHGNFELGGIIQGKISDIYAKILLVMFIFGITKTAIFPLHKWLPNAMVASYPVSALLHAVVVVKTGLFCIYKVILYIFGLSYLQHLFADYNWLIFFPIATIIYSSSQALRFNQIKMVLAYSTINQLSIAILSAFLLTPRGIYAAILHMISHSFTKICIFYAAGNIYSVKNAYRVGELIGIRSTMPITSFVMLIAGLSLMGMPPFAGFISKFYIMLAAAELENVLVMVVLAASTIFSALYMIKMLIFIYRPTSKGFIVNLKFKPKFAPPIDESVDGLVEGPVDGPVDESVDINHKQRAVNKKHDAEAKMPKLMIISTLFCLTGVVLFYFISRLINKFIVFI